MVAIRRALVMDDEDVVCRSYERVLSRAGFEVEKAHDGRQALDEVRKRPYDVMLADLRMPGMDGMSVVRQVRETHPDLPVIVITGYPSEETMEEASRLGVMDYMTKPVTPEVLNQVTHHAVEASPLAGQPRFTGTEVPAVAPVAIPPPPLQEVLAPPVAVPESVEKTVEGIGRRIAGFVQKGAALIAAPLIGLVYVIFLPFIGFAIVLGLGTKALVQKLVAKEV